MSNMNTILLFDNVSATYKKGIGIFDISFTLDIGEFVFIMGPTGSGKTTTLYACLRMLNKIGVKMLTAEDPVEYPIEGIVQVQINDSQGMTFSKALKAFLRQDPDIILVGEMRDLETASIGIEASLTGISPLLCIHPTL